MMRSALFVFASVVAAVLVSCNNASPVVAGGEGGSTETTNGLVITGVVQTDAGDRVSNAAIQVRPDSYLPFFGASAGGAPLRPDTATCSEGRFRFIAPDTLGPRALVVFTADDGAVAARDVFLAARADSVDLGVVTLKAPGAVNGVLAIEALEGDAYVAVRGAELWTGVDPSGAFLLPGLPPGAYALHCIVQNESTATGLDYPLVISASDTVTLEDTLLVADLSRNCSAWWSGDNLDGDTLPEQTGGLAARVEGVSLDTGRIGAGLRFDANHDIIRTLSPLTTPDSGSIALWFNAAALDSGGVYRLVSSNTSSFEITIRNRHIVNELYAAELSCLTDTVTTLEANRWYHLTCTWNRATHEQRIYLDGVLTARGTAADDPAGSVTLIFGNGVLSNHRHPFRGMLDEIRLYRGLLDIGQIRALALGARK